MTEPTGDAPLSRRELREQRRRAETSAGHVVSPAPPSDDTDSDRSEPAAPVPAAVPHRVPATTESASSTSSSSADAGGPLTRRQMRDIERQRTAGIPVVTDDGDSADALEKDSAAPVSAVPAPSAPATARTAPSTKAAEPVSVRTGAPEAAPERPQLPMPVSFPRGAEHTPAREKSGENASAAAGVGQASTATESASSAPVDQHNHAAASAGPTVSDAFGRNLSAAPVSDASDKSVKEVVGTAFDSLLSSGEAGSTTAPHALILPSIPSSTGLGSALTENGGVVLTGSIDLPVELSTTGQHPNYFEKPELDAMFDGDEDPQANTGSSPVSAARAISTHTAARDLIAPPAPQKNSKLLLTLSITAGVLAVSVLAVVIVGLMNGAL